MADPVASHPTAKRVSGMPITRIVIADRLSTVAATDQVIDIAVAGWCRAARSTTRPHPGRSRNLMPASDSDRRAGGSADLALAHGRSTSLASGCYQTTSAGQRS